MSKLKVSQREKILAPEGVHNARIVRIVELGTQPSDEWGDKFKIELSYELVDESAVFNEEKGEQNFVVRKKYNRSLHKRSDLAKHITAMTGNKFEADDEFEMDDLLDQACQVEITHSDDGQYANITGVMKVAKGTKVKKAESDLQSLYLDESFDSEVFETLPEYMQDMIADTDEYKELFPDEKPKSKKKSKDEDDEDEKPKRKGKRVEEEEEDETPKRKPAKKVAKKVAQKRRR
jgi:hypothetical protein